MDNFPPILSYVAPTNILTAKEAVVFLCVGGSERMMRQTDDWRIPVFLEISNTDWYICDAPAWLSTRSPTRSHFPQYRYVQILVCRCLDACQLNRCLMLSYSKFRRLRSFQLLLGNSFNNFYAVCPLSRYNFITELLSFYWMACSQT